MATLTFYLLDHFTPLVLSVRKDLMLSCHDSDVLTFSEHPFKSNICQESFCCTTVVLGFTLNVHATTSSGCLSKDTQQCMTEGFYSIPFDVRKQESKWCQLYGWEPRLCSVWLICNSNHIEPWFPAKKRRKEQFPNDHVVTTILLTQQSRNKPTFFLL